MIASLVFLVILIVVIAVIAHVKNNSKASAATQNQLETYTGKVRSILANITPPVTEMTSAPTSNADPAAIQKLNKSVPDWEKAFESSITEVQTVLPAAGTDAATQLFTESIQLYSTAVQTYKLVPDLPADQQDAVLGTAQAQVVQANQLWTTGVDLLDQARSDAGLKSSGLRSPESTNAAPTPQVSFSVPPGTQTSGAGSGGKSGKKSGKGGH